MAAEYHDGRAYYFFGSREALFISMKALQESNFSEEDERDHYSRCQYGGVCKAGPQIININENNPMIKHIRQFREYSYTNRNPKNDS